jgi:RNA polymerase sigma factor (sigma-70 family)
MDETVDKVFLHIYTELQEKPDISEKLVLWAFSLADRKINELNEEYARQFIKLVSTAQLSSEEMRQMQEDLTANADINPVPSEESDENSFGLDGFDLPEILSDAGIEEDIINKADLDEQEDDINRILLQLPAEEVSVFELYYLYRFSIPEIAQIKNMRTNKVDELLHDARKQFMQTTDDGRQTTQPDAPMNIEN